MIEKSASKPLCLAHLVATAQAPRDPLINPEQVSPMVSVRKSRRTGAGRLVACQVSATQDCGQTPWAQLVDSERLGDVQKARIPPRAACPGSPACTAPRDTNCGLSGRHATYSGLIRGSLAVSAILPGPVSSSRVAATIFFCHSGSPAGRAVNLQYKRSRETCESRSSGLCLAACWLQSCG